MRLDYYSEDWFEATSKFLDSASRFNNCKWVVSNKTKFSTPYVTIGDGPEKVVINSGVHGLEGYFGSAAQLMTLREIIPTLSSEFLKKYTIVIIHVINGWGMQNRMREVMDPSGGLVDLNRNFGIDFSKPESLPKNKKYSLSHSLLLSEPNEKEKFAALKKFYHTHKRDGAWDAIKNGQFQYPYGLHYGGHMQMPENKMALHIYDEIMKDANSLISIGMHTGIGRFNRKEKTATSQLLVSHPSNHPSTQKFCEIFGSSVQITPDETAVNGPTLLGDLVDCLENRYADKNIPIYTADFEIGTGEFPIDSPILKRMDMGDARYDLLNYGKINDQTLANLTESWYPSDLGWRQSALHSSGILFYKLFKYLEKTK